MYLYVFDYKLNKAPDGQVNRTAQVVAPCKSDAWQFLAKKWAEFNCTIVEYKLRTVSYDYVITDVPRRDP